MNRRTAINSLIYLKESGIFPFTDNKGSIISEEAIDMAIDALEVDESNPEVIYRVPKGATNGDLIKDMFNVTDIGFDHGDKVLRIESYDSWTDMRVNETWLNDSYDR